MWLLRAVVVLGLLVALWAAAPEGFVPSVLMTAVVLATAVAFALRPEFFVGSVAPTLVLIWWTLVVKSAFPDGALVAAAGLLASHLAAVLLGYGPARMTVGSDLVLTWVTRGAAVWVAALAVWVTERTYAGHSIPGAFWLIGLSAALVGAVVAAVLIPTRAMQEER